MSYFAELDRYDATAELMAADADPVITDADLGWPDGAIAAVDAAAWPEDGKEGGAQ